MSIFFMKSLLSLVLLSLAIFNMFTMLEIFGRNEKVRDIAKLKRIHRTGGFLYLLVYVVITYYCLEFLISSKVELSPRSAFHSLFAFSVPVLFGLKVSLVRVYRQYYNQAKVLGLLIGLITFAMFWTSGGYYLIVTEFGRYKGIDRVVEHKARGPLVAGKKEGPGWGVRRDPGSIGRGKNLFDSKCSFCHDPYSEQTIVGPGLRGLLRKPYLPVSGLPATPENVRRQLTGPLEKMPSFAYLSEEEMTDLVAFLNTL